MESQRERQLEFIWEYIASPISIPVETRKKLTDLLGDLLSGYWEGCKINNSNLAKGDEHEKQDKS